MPYEIKHRFSGAVIFTATGDTLRAAVLEAAKADADLSGANLSGADLSGADLSDADLSDADLSGANLSHANLSDAYLSRADLFGANLSHANLSDADLSGANLSGADLSDAKIGAHIVARKAAQVWRYDGYEFFGFVLRDGGLLIRAGCQTRLIEDYRQHVADKYPGTAKAVETLALLDFIEARAKA